MTSGSEVPAGLIETMTNLSSSSDGTAVSSEVQIVVDRIRSGKLSVEEDNAIFSARQDAEKGREEREKAKRKRQRSVDEKRMHKQQAVDLWNVGKVGQRPPSHGDGSYVRCNIRFEVGGRDFYCCRPVHLEGQHAQCDGVKIEAIEHVSRIYEYNDGDDRTVEVESS